MDSNAVEKVVKSVVSDYLRPNGNMTLFAAEHLARKVRDKAKSMGVKAVIAITNRGANPVLVQCLDDSYIASYDIALNKAYTSVALKMSTKDLSKLAKPDGSLYGIQFTNNGRIVIFGGGEPLTNKDGAIIGGVGVSGGSEEQDTALAKYAKEIFEKGLN
ncbi:MAG: heme-binding protein [Clostridia bacterium]|nr:heme-binding protein [Clostridia bacterium]